MVANVLAMGMLVVETISDIKSKSVSLVRMGIYFTTAIILNLFYQYQPVYSMVGGIVVGAVVLLMAVITREGIGYGDGALFVCLGTMLGLSKNMRLLLFSLLIASLFGGMYIVVKKKNIKTEVPFIPCVLVTFIMMLLWR